MLRSVHLLFIAPFLLCLATAHAEPLQIYILAGQSNMQGHAHVRTIEHIGMDPATRPLLEEMQNADGTYKVCERVWISSLGSAEKIKTGRLTTGYGAEQNGPKIGPEFTFGITIEKYTSGPILLIKTAWGGKSLNTDFRSPSAGPYSFNEKQIEMFARDGKELRTVQEEKDKATGISYRLMIDHVKSVLENIREVVPDYDASQGYELAGFIWLQGWNDLVDSSTYPNRDKPGGYDSYSHLLTHFIRDVRVDLNAKKLPFVIGVLGIGGPTSLYSPEQMRYKAIHDNFRAAMAAPAQLKEFEGNVAALLTERYWDQELSNAKDKENAIHQAAKSIASERKLKPDEERSMMEKMRNEGLTEREKQIVEKGISNFEFHYLGSAKILGGIGKGLAETMAELKQLKK